jgi:hypothetical protein
MRDPQRTRVVKQAKRLRLPAQQWESDRTASAEN